MNSMDGVARVELEESSEGRLVVESLAGSCVSSRWCISIEIARVGRASWEAVCSVWRGSNRCVSDASVAI